MNLGTGEGQLNQKHKLLSLFIKSSPDRGSREALNSMAETTELQKGLGLSHVFCLAAGAMISSGLFILPGLAHAMAGPGVICSYLLAGLLATTGALSIAELATAMPKAGGDYFFITRGFGPGVGTVSGFLSWFSLSLKTAFAVVGMATFAAMLIDLHAVAAGVLLCLAFVAVNLLGVKAAAGVQVTLVMGLFGLLVGYIVIGLTQIRADLLLPFAPYGADYIFTAVGFVFVSYGGLLEIASIAEEVRNPGRTIPQGLLLALFTVTLVYTLAVMTTSGILEAEVLDHSLTPLSEGGRVLLGPAGYIAMSIGAIIAFISTANAGLMAASRYLLALSRDRLLPRPLARVNQHFQTPHFAILVTGAVIILSLFLELTVLVEAASTVLILVNLLSCLSVIVLRESGLQNYRPAFRVPLYPWLQVGGMIGLSFILVEMGQGAYFISLGLILIGFLTFWFYGRKRAHQEFALMHLVGRLTAHERVSGTLESELKEIIRERDAIVSDRFDQAVEKAIVLDLAEKLSSDRFFHLASETLASQLSLGPEPIAHYFRTREDESSLLLSPTLAVFHILVPGEHRFEILLARAHQGIIFPRAFDGSPASSPIIVPGEYSAETLLTYVRQGKPLPREGKSVHAVFILVGTRDEKNLQLRALTAIAQIVLDPDFDDRWLAAKNEQALKDLLLLAHRQRK